MTRLLDFSEPIGLLMVAVLHFVPDEKDPRGVVARYRDALPMYFRSYAEVRALFEGLELVMPGVVSAPQWRPELDYCAVSTEDVYVGGGPLRLTAVHQHSNPLPDSSSNEMCTWS